MAHSIATSAVRWTEGGALPLVVDASSCTLGLLNEVPGALEGELAEAFAKVEIVDSIAWVHDTLLPRLAIEHRVGSVLLHPPCAAAHLGLTEKLEAIAGALAEDVLTGSNPTCCGTAGDRGLLHPELPAAALAPAAEELADASPSACLCSNRTCEIGLSEATGRSFGSFVLLLESLTRPANHPAP
jgi:D-lactate dehydrogenase